jgi:hypothetical protein
VCQLIPPTLAAPFSPLKDTVIFSLSLVQENRSRVIKYIEERVIVEDEISTWSISRELLDSQADRHGRRERT